MTDDQTLLYCAARMLTGPTKGLMTLDPEDVISLISEKRSEAARADLTGFMLAWVVAVAEKAITPLDPILAIAENNPQPSRIIEPVTPDTVFRAGDRVRAKENSPFGTVRAGQWYDVIDYSKGNVRVPNPPRELSGWVSAARFDLIERAPQ